MLYSIKRILGEFSGSGLIGYSLRSNNDAIPQSPYGDSSLYQREPYRLERYDNIWH